MNDLFWEQRQQMVEQQIRRRGIKDPRVLEIMGSIPRHRFIGEHLRSMSYRDGPLEIGFGQTISQPYIVAYMTENLELSGRETVLEIGTGSGYQTAVLAELSREVYTVEIVEALSLHAQSLLITELGYSHIHFKIGSGRDGWKEHQPYDRIILTAAPTEVPPILLTQLTENGILLSPEGDYFQELVRFRKRRGGWEKERLIGVSFVPLTGQ